MNQLFYFWCSVQNRNPLAHLDPKLEIKHFKPNIHSESIDPRASPSRILSDLFWKTLPWNHISQELGSLHVFDTGCGSGRYGSYLDTISHGLIESYKGIDVYEHADWKQRQMNPKFSFEKSDGKRVLTCIPEKTNFFMSQSAIEHFPNDRRYFEQVNIFIRAHSNRSILQVHLIPSAACMALYGRHGYRQYTPRTISTITRIFPNDRCFLFGLGGPACNRVHQEFITDPILKTGEDLRNTKPDQYRTHVLKALEEDATSTNNDPSFWALVVCSNWKQSFTL